jgi:radical SAM protein with 4Fe4S-binding SPASM domain
MTDYKKILSKKINAVQLDPFGYCNAKCWYCPVRYQPQPIDGKTNMSPEFIRKLFDDIVAEGSREDGLIDPYFNMIYTAHYNEILLYKHLEELLALCREYGFKISIASNGTPLTKQKTDLLFEYADVVSNIVLNVPAFEREVWSKRAGFKEDHFDRLMNNLNYAVDKLKFLQPNAFHIVVNGVDEKSFDSGHLIKGTKFESLEIDLDVYSGELRRQTELAKELFPSVTVATNNMLIDRTKTISDYIENPVYHDDGEVIGCTNTGDRISEWLHVNASGDVFLCCMDYNFDYKFGNLKDKTIREIWGSQDHIAVLDKALKEICSICSFAIKGCRKQKELKRIRIKLDDV